MSLSAYPCRYLRTPPSLSLFLQAGTRDKGQDEWHRISSIPMAQLEHVRSWLDMTDLVSRGGGVCDVMCDVTYC